MDGWLIIVYFIDILSLFKWLPWLLIKCVYKQARPSDYRPDEMYYVVYIDMTWLTSE